MIPHFEVLMTLFSVLLVMTAVSNNLKLLKKLFFFNLLLPDESLSLIEYSL